MKTEILITSSPSWSAGVPFIPAREPQTTNAARFPRQASVGPIELHIDGHHRPSAIAILE
jgi:hypothetical protein